MNTLYLINKIVATDYKQYYELNRTNNRFNRETSKIN